MEDEQGSSSIDMLLRQCEDILEVVVYAQDLFPDDSGDAVVKAVSDVYKYLETRKYAPKRGRPSATQLEQLLSFHFRISDIANILQVSESTVKRRISQFGLESTLQTEISDSDLDVLTAVFAHHFPNRRQNSYDGTV